MLYFIHIFDTISSLDNQKKPIEQILVWNTDIKKQAAKRLIDIGERFKSEPCAYSEAHGNFKFFS